MAASATLAFFVIAAGSAQALDANRQLSQCVQRIWQVQQGLPYATVLAICQSSSGYLWLGTPAGLVRFDGVTFTAIREATPREARTREVKPPAIDQPWVRQLCEDSDHNLWLATEEAGLICLRGGAATGFMHTQGLPSQDVRCVIASRQGGVWAGTAAGLVRVAGGVTGLESQPSVSLKDIRALCEADDGRLWIGGAGNQLTVLDQSQVTSIRIESLPESGSVNALLATDDGVVWVGTSQGLIRIDKGQQQVLHRADGLADDFVNCLAKGRNENIWAGTRDGFTRIHAGELSSFRSADGLSQSTVNTLFEDREGGLWVGTKQGLNQFIDRRTVPFTTREGLPTNDTGPVFQDAAGTLWVGTLGGGLVSYDGRGFTALAGDAGLPSTTILSLADGDDGQLWVGTDHGLALVRNRAAEQIFGTAEGLPSERVNCLCRDRTGTLWAGTQAGLVQWRDGKLAPPGGDAELLKLPIKALAEFGDGLLVAAAGANGLLYCAADQLKPFDQVVAPDADYTAFFNDPSGLLWMGTRGGGVVVIDGQKVTTLTVKDGLNDDEIFGIVADDQDRIWMACSNGIFFVLRAEVRKFIEGQTRHVTSKPFSPMDSLRTAECKAGVQPVICKTGQGQIWFSTTRGLITIDPARMQRTLPPIPVLVERMIVNGRSQMLDQPLKLPPGKVNLEFGFAALTFVSAPRVTFRYRLEGFDQDWVEAGTRREAFYTNLAPGSYRFRVAAKNLDGEYQEAATPVTFTLAPYLVQRWWFFPACAVALGLAGWGIYRLRVQQIKQRLRAVVAERSRIARELHDTLMQGFSGVTMQMQAMLASLPPSRQRTMLAEIIDDAAASLRDARRSIAGLRRERDKDSGLAASIKRAAVQISETHDVVLKLNVNLEHPLPQEVEYNLLRIAQEAMSNAVRHSRGRQLEVSVDETPKRVRLLVRDDGVGLPEQDGETALPGHYGLIGIRERASQIGADLQIETAPGRGTTITVVVPLESTSDTSLEPELRDIPGAPLVP